jgi:hypothetical protein
MAERVTARPGEPANGINATICYEAAFVPTIVIALALIVATGPSLGRSLTAGSAAGNAAAIPDGGVAC